VHGDLQPVALGEPVRDRDRPRDGLPRLQPGPARLRPPDPRPRQPPDPGPRRDAAVRRHLLHQYQPLTREGNAEIGGGFNDDPLWLVVSTCAYVKETGDISILSEPVGYADTPGGEQDLLHHLETSIAYTLARRGPHGLPLIGHADWNDCLNLNCFSTDPNESFQTAGDVEGSVAESAMIAGLFLSATREFVALYRHLDRPADAERLGRAREEMLTAVEAESGSTDSPTPCRVARRRAPASSGRRRR
jgi:hypothetical protein